MLRDTFNYDPEAEIILYIKQGEYFIDNTIHFDNIKPGDKMKMNKTSVIYNTIYQAQVVVSQSQERATPIQFLYPTTLETL